MPRREPPLEDGDQEEILHEEDKPGWGEPFPLPPPPGSALGVNRWAYEMGHDLATATTARNGWDTMDVLADGYQAGQAGRDREVNGSAWARDAADYSRAGMGR